MREDTLFRALFAVLFGCVAAIRLMSHGRAGTFRENITSRAERSWVAVVRLLLGGPLLLSIGLYLVAPDWLAWCALPLPGWLRWCGVALGGLAAAGLWWIHAALGTHFSPTLRVDARLQLVREGPYRWVRHPMYSTLMALHIAYFLVSASWLIGALGVLVMALVMGARTPGEESLLIARFGDEYRDYMRRTGRFLPRLARPPL